jgi:hypothetical protein
MTLNFVQKIFGVALVVLTFMLVVAVYPVRLTAEITDYLDVITNRCVPANESVSLINEHVFEQNIVLSRVTAQGAESLGYDSVAATAAFESLHDRVVAKFEMARQQLQSDSRIAVRYRE